jgi:hypothetical protein
MSNVVLRTFEAARAHVAMRPKLIALAGTLVFISGLLAGTGFWAGVGIGLLAVSLSKIWADRRRG